MEEKKGFWTYENKMLIVLCFAFGFVFFDRFALANLASFVMPDLGMNNTQLGLTTSVFALTWAIIGVVGGAISDNAKNRKKVLIIFVMAFSLCSFATGLAAGFAMLLIIRLIMGATEGPVMPISQSFILPQSSPHRRAMNMGLFQVTSTALIATLLGPIIQVALAESIGWRWTFLITIIPGVLASFLIYKVLVNPDTSQVKQENKVIEKPKLSEVLLKRNVVLSMIGSIFLIGWYICTLTFVPSYLVTVKGLEPTQMSYVMSAFGLGSVLWGFLIPRLSDSFGRKPLVCIGALMGIFAPLGMYLASADNLVAMMAIAFVGFAGQSVTALMLTTIPAESGDPRYVATVIGSNQLTAELIGAGGGATVLGMVGDRYGLGTVMIVLAVCMIVVFIIGLFYKESAPMVLAKRQKSTSAV